VVFAMHAPPGRDRMVMPVGLSTLLRLTLSLPKGPAPVELNAGRKPPGRGRLKPLFDAACCGDEWFQDTTASQPAARSPQPAARGPRSEVRGPNSTNGQTGCGPRAAIPESLEVVQNDFVPMGFEPLYCVFVPLAPPVIGVITTFRNHTTS
jgi:hypothetical protein